MSAPTPLSSQMCPRSVESPSLMSIMAEANLLSQNAADLDSWPGKEMAGKSAGRSFSSAEANDRGRRSAQFSGHIDPVPGPAPDRSTAFPFGTEPSTTMSARMPPGDSAVSPPARLTLKLPPASADRAGSRPPTLRQTPRNGQERNAASGSPPMAAMSLSPRARQRWPTVSAGCHARLKWIFSRLKSVVTSAM